MATQPADANNPSVTTAHTSTGRRRDDLLAGIPSGELDPDTLLITALLVVKLIGFIVKFVQGSKRSLVCDRQSPPADGNRKKNPFVAGLTGTRAKLLHPTVA